MSEGRVRWFSKSKRYGFVITDLGDVFIHYSAFKEHFIPKKNELISFNIIEGEKGLKAEEIERIKKG